MTVIEMERLSRLLRKFRLEAANDRVRPMAATMADEVDAQLQLQREYNKRRSAWRKP